MSSPESLGNACDSTCGCHKEGTTTQVNKPNARDLRNLHECVHDMPLVLAAEPTSAGDFACTGVRPSSMSLEATFHAAYPLDLTM